MSDAILMVRILEVLAQKDEFGRYVEDYKKIIYDSFYEYLANFSGASNDDEHKQNIDALMIKMHKACLVDLVHDEYTGKPCYITLRPEGLNIYRALNLEW
ncbi:MAG: hypothetical protein N3D72_00665 [Candidatus Methanomethyliaceae archaeon]|nr:hypothetical protein [Candidatus Methanomethyliaceae archaeon]